MSATDGDSRIERLRASMREQGLDAIIAMKPQNSFYLSGFNPIIYSHPVVAILPLESDPVILMHALRDDHARQTARVKDVRLFGAWSTKQTMGHDWLTALSTILSEKDLLSGTIGIEGDYLPVTTYAQFKQRLPEVTFEDASHLIMDSRMVKDVEEIELLRAAARISDIGMDAAIAAARERVSEQEVSIRAMAAMNRAWVDQFPDYEVADFANAEGGVHNGLWCYCLTGDRIHFNADNPTKRLLTDGELALIIIWTNCNGMHAENERTVAVGELADPQRQIYEAILQIREESQPAIRAGATCAEVFEAAASVYRRLGYEAYLPGRIGHGMGLGPHEHPSFAPDDQTLLRPGMIMTFEPNLRVPDVGGLQHSDTLLITEDGYESLNFTERGYIQV